MLLNGFLHVSLDQATFGIPWGKYRWLRMPFGILLAPEELQGRLGQPLVRLNGCKEIADDILVFGCVANTDEAVKDHDENLIALFQNCSSGLRKSHTWATCSLQMGKT